MRPRSSFLWTSTLGTAVPAIEQSGLLGQMIGTTLIEGFVLLIPLSIGVAIMRSGLYEIDIIINRTLVYGSLTAALVVLYFGAIVVLQRLLVFSPASGPPWLLWPPRS